jgi:putative nucleotidyltransferase with HDIG domain
MSQPQINSYQLPASYARVFWGLAFFIGTLALLYAHIVVWPTRLNVDQVIPYDIISPSDASYVDTTERIKLQASGKASILDPRVADQTQLQLAAFFADLRSARLQGSDPTAQVEILAGKYPVPSDIIALLITLPDKDLSDTEDYARDTLSDYMDTAISRDEIQNLQATAKDAAALTVREKVPVFFLQTNITEAPDIPAVQGYINKLVTHRIKAGEVILGAGGTVTQASLDMLGAVEDGMLKQRLYRFAGASLLLAVLMLVWYVHMRIYKKRIFNSPSLWAQLALIFIVALAISLLIGRLPFRYIHYAVPLGTAAAVIILVTIYDAILASYVGIGLAVIASLALNYNTNLVVYCLVSTTYPVVFLSRRSTTRDLGKFGLNLALANLVLMISVALFSVEAFSWWASLCAALTGIVAAVIALGITPMLDMLSTQLTPSKLQALLNPELPLLKRLLEEAPGTYFHCMIMASMCEEACNEIGADGLLAKVGCMYHDIGKLKRPGFFAENISDPAQNPHRHLPPESSFNIIVQHIQDGIDMGRKAGLPPEIIAFIPEHHGTTITKFFLEEARRRAIVEGNEVDAAHFRYGGPDPRSRETGVAMLADICEAKIRAMDKFTESDVRSVVNAVVQEKMNLGHLDNSKLTIGDLRRAAEAFSRVLVTLHHSRLKYPEQMDGEESQPAPINAT